MTEFYVEKQILRLESTSFITGTSGLFVDYHTTKCEYQVFKSKYCLANHPHLNISQPLSQGHENEDKYEPLRLPIQNL